MSGPTTRLTPPEVAPAITRRAVPRERTKPLIVGFGPMKATSNAPESNASMAAGPALKVITSSRAGAIARANAPVATPMTAAAWVMLGK
jgi:hypothetical protein